MRARVSWRVAWRPWRDGWASTAAPSRRRFRAGLFNAGDVVIAPLRAEIAARLPECRIILAEQSPAAGAALLARSAA